MSAFKTRELLRWGASAASGWTCTWVSFGELPERFGLAMVAEAASLPGDAHLKSRMRLLAIGVGDKVMTHMEGWSDVPGGGI